MNRQNSVKGVCKFKNISKMRKSHDVRLSLTKHYQNFLVMMEKCPDLFQLCKSAPPPPIPISKCQFSNCCNNYIESSHYKFIVVGLCHYNFCFFRIIWNQLVYFVLFYQFYAINSPSYLLGFFPSPNGNSLGSHYLKHNLIHKPGWCDVWLTIYWDCFTAKVLCFSSMEEVIVWMCLKL